MKLDRPNEVILLPISHRQFRQFPKKDQSQVYCLINDVLASYPCSWLLVGSCRIQRLFPNIECHYVELSQLTLYIFTKVRTINNTVSGPIDDEDFGILPLEPLGLQLACIFGVCRHTIPQIEIEVSK